jgi:hypothetical protein
MITRDLIPLLENIVSADIRYPKLDSLLSTCSQLSEAGGEEGLRQTLSEAVSKEGKTRPSTEGVIQILKGNIFHNGVSKLYRELHQCLAEVQSLEAKLAVLPSGNIIRESFFNKLQAFEAHLEDFLSQFRAEPALGLVRAGVDLFYDYNFTKRHSLTALEALAPTSPPPSGMEELTVFFPATQTYREVVEKLAAIADLYDEVCNLAGVSAAAFPLRISKIESGSLWLKLFGESKVVALITKLIENGANFTYRNFTQEGRLREIPRNIETIRAELKLLEELEQAGIPTAELRENIEKSSVIISDKINTLLSGSSEITVNDKSFGVRQELERMIREQSKLRLIEDGTQHQEIDPEEFGRAQLPPADNG